jgi:hypothetical protein
MYKFEEAHMSDRTKQEKKKIFQKTQGKHYGLLKSLCFENA